MEILEYKIADGVRAFSTKRGGTDGNYARFNITHYCGDSPEHVAHCRKELCARLGISDGGLILPRQVHDCNILHIDKELLARPGEERNEALQNIDAVITEQPRICIGVSTADCVPILLCDTAKRTIAAVHAGWRGTVNRIVEKTVTEMRDKYRCRPEDIKCVIGPSIGRDAFEVGDEVYEAFENNQFPMQKIATRMAKWHIDLWEANRLSLAHCGIPNENIEIAGICTHKEYNEFFSARRLGIKSGRIFSGIMLE